ncbi:MAG: hypothetical protein ACRYFS_03620 [Janthinobacterium lividum]
MNNDQIRAALKQIETLGNTRDLNAFESVLRNDPFADGPEWQVVFDALSRREGEVRSRESDGLRAGRQQSQRDMMDALASVQTKGSGTKITQRIKNGRRVPMTGNGFDVPSSGSGDSGGNDPYRAGLSQFLDQYIRPNLSEGYVSPGKGGRGGQIIGGEELLDKEGVVPPDAGRAGLSQFLLHVAEDGTLDTAGIDAFAKEKGLSASVAQRARGAARKAARAEGPTGAQSESQARKKAVGAVIKSANLELGNALKLSFLRGKQAGKDESAVSGFGGDGGGGNGNEGGDGGDGGGDPAPGSSPEDRKKVQDENRQHRDEGADIRARMRGEDRQHRDEGSVARENGRRDEAEQRRGVTAENRQHRDEGSVLRDQAREDARDRARQEKERRDGRAELDAVMAAQHKSGALSDEEYEAHLAGKAFDTHIPSSERRSATGKLGSLGAKRQTKDAREKAAAEREDKAQKKNDYEEAKQRAEELAEAQQKSEDAAAKNNNPRKKSGKSGGGFDLYKGSLLIGEFSSSVRAGMQTGNAAGAVAEGLNRGVTGAASAFIHAGESALGLFLSPFGRAGGAVAAIGGGLGQMLVSVLSAGGGIASAGLKLGVGLAGGIVGGLVAGLGMGAGAVIGGIIRMLGGPGGVVAGAVFGGGIATGLISIFTSTLGLVGGAVGQALSAVGSAFGQLGSSIGTTLGNLQGVLSDLIATGKAFASATFSVARGGNLSLGAAGVVASLSQMLTGSPGGLNSVFSGFGHMSQYNGFRLQAFGVGGATGTDPLGDLVKSASAYAGMDPIRRQLLVQGGYEGNDAIGNLFALNAVHPGIAAKIAANAQQTAMSPQESVNALLLASNLSVVGMQIDRLKTKFLSDLMPAINMGLNLFSGWFSKNETTILSGLENVGRWFATQFPGYFRDGVNIFFDLGKSFAKSLPGIAQFGKDVYSTFALLTTSIRAGLAALLSVVGTFISLLPGKAGDAGKSMIAAAQAMTKRGTAMDPHGADKFFDGIAARSPALMKSIQGDQDKTNAFLNKVGVNNMSDAAFNQGIRNASRGVSVDVTVHTSSTVHHTIDMERMKHTVTEHLAGQEVRAFQRAGA